MINGRTGFYLFLKSLNAELDQERERRKEHEDKLGRLLNSPGAVTNQMDMWANKVEILQQITDLQGSLIDKDFIIKQNEVIKNLQFEMDAEPESVSETTPSLESSVINSSEVSSADLITLDETNCTISGETDDTPPRQPPPMMLKRGQSHTIYNSNYADPGSNFPHVDNIHISDARRMDGFLNNLKRLEKVPRDVDSVLITDSNGHKVRGKDIDPDGNTWVISSSGLCLVSTVHALRSLTAEYSGIKKVIYHIGLNDELHKRQHIGGERHKYLTELRSVTKKVFPSADIKYILPLSGGIMSKDAISSLKADIMKYIPDCGIYTPPDMKYKFNDEGVHLNESGVLSFKAFIRSDIVRKRRPRRISESSGRRSNTNLYSTAVDEPQPNRHRQYEPPRPVSQRDSFRPNVYYPDMDNYPPLQGRNRSLPNTESTRVPRQLDEKDKLSEITAVIINVLSEFNLI